MLSKWSGEHSFTRYESTQEHRVQSSRSRLMKLSRFFFRFPLLHTFTLSFSHGFTRTSTRRNLINRNESQRTFVRGKPSEPSISSTAQPYTTCKEACTPFSLEACSVLLSNNKRVIFPAEPLKLWRAREVSCAQIAAPSSGYHTRLPQLTNVSVACEQWLQQHLAARAC